MEPRRNVELKAADPDPAASLRACRALDGAEDGGELWQRDTYFTVPSGALKLREEHPGRPHLVQYHRADEARERESRYRIAFVEDATELAAALRDALGVRVVVEKRRRLFLWRGVRIHLDRVEGLGAFVELEAVAPPESDLRRERALVAQLRDHLAITGDRIVACGYAALLLAQGPPPPAR